MSKRPVRVALTVFFQTWLAENVTRTLSRLLKPAPTTSTGRVLSSRTVGFRAAS